MALVCKAWAQAFRHLRIRVMCADADRVVDAIRIRLPVARVALGRGCRFDARARAPQNVIRFDASSSTLTIAGLRQLATHATSLTYLELRDCVGAANAEAFRVICDMTSLRTLDLNSTSAVSDATLLTLTGATQLRRLVLGSVGARGTSDTCAR